MPQPNGVDDHLTGDAAEHCPVALLLIDVINDLEGPESEPVARFVGPMAEKVAALKRRAKQAGVPCVYVNDNFGRWRSDVRDLVEHCRREGARGKPMVDLLAPDADDYFVLKPMLSGFYGTALDALLRHLGVRTLVLTGLCANACVLFTAADAHMRGYKLVIPSDCVATTTGTECGHSLDQMRRLFKAVVHLSAEIDVAALAGRVAVDAGEVLAAESPER